MATYSFLSTWRLDAPIERVWDVISEPAGYPTWWRYVASVEEISPGDADGVGQVQRTHWTTALPYTLAFTTRTTRAERPHRLEVAAIGELEGVGRWELAEEAGSTTIRYTWEVRTTKPWMNLLAPIARPAFAWNHGVIMRQGGEGLARRLGARLLRNESEAMSDTSIRPLLGGVALATVIASVLKARRAR